MPRRRQRARGQGVDVLMGSVKNPDNVERLARKYMRECKVDSSTDSEADNNESCGNPIATMETSEKMDILRLQFLDPYDGDSEDTTQLDNGSQEQIVSDEEPCGAPERPVSMDCASPLIQEQRMASAGHSLIPREATEVCMTSLHSTDTLKTSVQTVQSPTCSSDLSMDSGVATEEPTVTSAPCLLLGVGTRAGNRLPLVFTSSLTSEENSDLSMCETSLAKRKFSLKMEYEKLKRKKARVSEPMVC